LTWVRLDDDFPNHPKILKAGPIAALIQVRALCYSSHHLTNGFIPNDAMPTLMLGLNSLAITHFISEEGFGAGHDVIDIDWPSKMISDGLWRLDSKHRGYWIHDYLKYQPSKKDVLNARETTRIRVSTWRERNAISNGVGNDVTKPLVTALVTASPDPDPDLKKHPPKPPRASATPRASKGGAASAWASVMRAARSGRSNPEFIDAKIQRVLEKMGGFERIRWLGNVTTKPVDEAMKRKEFVELYREISP